VGRLVLLGKKGRRSLEKTSLKKGQLGEKRRNETEWFLHSVLKGVYLGGE